MALTVPTCVVALVFVGAVRRVGRIGDEDDALVGAIVLGLFGVIMTMTAVAGCLMRAFGSQVLQVTDGRLVVRHDCVLWRPKRRKVAPPAPIYVVWDERTWVQSLLENSRFRWPGAAGCFSVVDATGAVILRFGVGLNGTEAAAAAQRVRSLAEAAPEGEWRLL